MCFLIAENCCSSYRMTHCCKKCPRTAQNTQVSRGPQLVNFPRYKRFITPSPSVILLMSEIRSECHCLVRYVGQYQSACSITAAIFDRWLRFMSVFLAQKSIIGLIIWQESLRIVRKKLSLNARTFHLYIIVFIISSKVICLNFTHSFLMNMNGGWARSCS